MKNEIGQKFGNLEVIGYGRPSGKGRYWLCSCLKCGKIKQIRGDHLRGGLTRGCSSRCTNSTHGESKPKSKEYRIWDHIIQRCCNGKHPRYHDWGGRGIAVCKRWRHSFAAFLADMGRCPQGCYGIDRIHNNKDYAPDNCRWATRSEQMQNTRSNRLIKIGKDTKPLVEWLKIFKIPRLRFYKRSYAGWSEEEALTRPIRSDAAFVQQ